jgi:hypothetical protein
VPTLPSHQPAADSHACTYARTQGGPAAQEFFTNSPIGQALLSRAKASPVARSLDSANREAAGLAAAAAEKLAGPLQELAGAVSEFGATVAQGTGSLGLKGLVAASEAVAPLAQARLGATRAVAEPLAVAGQRLAAKSFEALRAQVDALPDPQERAAAQEALRPRIEQMASAGGVPSSVAGETTPGNFTGPALGSQRLQRSGKGKLLNGDV